MHTKKFILLFALLFASIVTAQSSPQLPHLFYGDAKADSTDLPAGSVIIAKVASIEKGRITTALGKYGGPSSSDGKLVVQGNINEDAVIEFFVSRIKANQTALFKSGKIENKNLTWTFPPRIAINASVFNESLTCIPGSDTNANISGLFVNITCNNTTAGTINNITNLGGSFFVGAPAPGGLLNTSSVFEISVTGNFTIVVTIGYSDTGVNESTLTIYKFVGGSWTPIPASDIISINMANNTITFKVSPGGTPYTAFGSSPQPEPTTTTAAGGGGAAAPGLSLSVSVPDFVTIQAGTSGSFDVVVRANNAPANTTIIDVSLPSGFSSAVTPNFINIPANSSGTFNVTISVPSAEPKGIITIRLTARSGAVSASRNSSINISAASAPAPTPTPTSAPAPAPTPTPAPEPTPPAGITGLVVANPTVAGAIVVVILAAIYVVWRLFRKRKATVKVAKKMKVKPE